MGSSRTSRVLTSCALTGVAASVAGLGTFGTFTAATSATSGTLASGTLTIALGNTGAATNRLTVGATGLVPGDTVQRSFDLTNSGNTDLSLVTLTTAATTSSLLDTDATNGLQMVVDRCSVAWTETGSVAPFTYTCGGSNTSIVASRAVIGSNLTLAGLSALTAGGTDHLRATLTFPSGAGNTLQNQSSVLTFTFTATQRNATSK